MVLRQSNLEGGKDSPCRGSLLFSCLLTVPLSLTFAIDNFQLSSEIDPAIKGSILLAVCFQVDFAGP